MQKINTNELKPGMIVATRVFSKKGQLLLKEDSILTTQMIAHLEYYSIPDIKITNEIPSVHAIQALAREKEIKDSYSLRIKRSPEYRRFKKDYTQKVTQFKNTMNDFIVKNSTFDENELLSETVTLFEKHNTTISMFDMLHNMRQIDDSTYAHCVNVSIISRMIGMWLNFSEADLNCLTIAGLLHDIGKSMIPNAILQKPGKLDDDEYREVQRHTQIGYDMLKNQPLDSRIKNAALMHHERCDGSGYPLGLDADFIDDFAIIVAIADVYDAMTADRCYRSGLCPFEVISIFEREGLNRYKPQYILTFLNRIANTYVNNKVLLSDGSTGRIVLINSQLTRPIIQLDNETFVNLEERLDLYVQAII